MYNNWVHFDTRISIHALREEGDSRAACSSMPAFVFLSTPSARRATSTLVLPNHGIFYFYPRPPRGGRRLEVAICAASAGISIHALREEGDSRDVDGQRVISISIHALREEGDSWTTVSEGGRFPFLSTPSARRATRFDSCTRHYNTISIHALREEGDLKKPCSNEQL